MTLSDYRKRLLLLPFITELPEPLRARIAMCLLWIGQPAQFAVGDAIFVQGDEDENTGCVLLQGEVEVLRGNQDAVRVQAPELLGEMQQLEPTAQRTATVQAIADAQTLLFSWHDFVVYSAVLLTTEEQIVLRDVIRNSAARRRT
ncbi:MAG: cyclic nucleotide-binding domain-containing protein [Candidatus Hydrogenedentes bacterium]|nr:cyclic nucleotide-binding domain-containing protein [Candidatus Hydrogenedentota bacterium]